MHQLTLGSLFDGIGGWQLAATRAGIRPVWSSEIEAFPLQVTREHFPDTLQLGDIQAIHGDAIEPVDIICAGSPCQDLSVAGKQVGLSGKRSGLFVKAIQIVREMQHATHGQFPRYFLWENVPGAFSSNHREDFRAVLEEIGHTELPMPHSHRWAPAGMVRTPSCDISWRVMDAQYWGVPQRRKRIFLVADFATRCRRSAEILFERKSLPRDSSAGERSGKNSSQASRRGIGTPDGSIDDASHYYTICGNIIGRENKNGGHQMGIGEDVMFTLNTCDRHAVVGALCARDFKGVGNEYVMENKLQVVNGRVRRLTPLEFERLQGLPDGWTKNGSDTARYKALGNGMAQPCADFIMRRIAEETQTYE